MSQKRNGGEIQSCLKFPNQHKGAVVCGSVEQMLLTISVLSGTSGCLSRPFWIISGSDKNFVLGGKKKTKQSRSM